LAVSKSTSYGISEVRVHRFPSLFRWKIVMELSLVNVALALAFTVI
jgi:hypothetical protein